MPARKTALGAGSNETSQADQADEINETDETHQIDETHEIDEIDQIDQTDEMRLHLLEHDPIEFRRTNITIWAERKGFDCRMTEAFAVDRLPALDQIDWLILMGGSQHAWDEAGNPWLRAEKALIARALDQGKIILGICFGAQLLAEALGAHLYPNKTAEIGWYPVQLTSQGRKSFLFRGIPESFVTFHWHSDHFSLPRGCIRLAQSPPTPNQAFIRPGLPVAGIQFHPEYTLEMVSGYARRYGHEWPQGLYSEGRERVLEKTAAMLETYWLMERLLDNMLQEFTGIGPSL